MMAPASAVGQGAARVFALPLRHRAWQGAPGEFPSPGVGSSLDFQDHRPYAPGDDPRMIDWRACARTGQYLMKIYRAEAAPAVDVFVDVSRSMQLTPGKWRRTRELIAFVIAAARASTRSAVRCWTHDGFTLAASDPEFWLGETGEEDPGPEVAAGGGRASEGLEPAWPVWPVRRGSLRVVISDLLLACDPLVLFRGVTRRPGLAVVFAPWDVEEAAPEWSGNLRFEDIETGQWSEQRFFDRDLRAYTAAYQRHFAAIRSAAQRTGALFARVSSAGTLMDALAEVALPTRTLTVRDC